MPGDNSGWNNGKKEYSVIKIIIIVGNVLRCSFERSKVCTGRTVGDASYTGTNVRENPGRLDVR